MTEPLRMNYERIMSNYMLIKKVILHTRRPQKFPSLLTSFQTVVVSCMQRQLFVPSAHRRVGGEADVVIKR